MHLTLGLTEWEYEKEEYCRAGEYGIHFLEVVFDAYNEAIGENFEDPRFELYFEYYKDKGLLMDAELSHLYEIYNISKHFDDPEDMVTNHDIEDLMDHMRSEIYLFDII